MLFLVKLLIFKNPETNAESTEWFSVENLADHRKTPKKGKTETVNEKYRELLKPISRQNRYESFQEQRFQVTFHPLGDGNCQISATAHQMDRLGIHRSTSKVREEIVKYLERKSKRGMPGRRSWIFHSVSIYKRWLLMELMTTS